MVGTYSWSVLVVTGYYIGWLSPRHLLFVELPACHTETFFRQGGGGLLHISMVAQILCRWRRLKRKQY